MRKLLLLSVLLLAGCKGGGFFGLGGGSPADSPPSSLPIGSLIPSGTFAILGTAAAVCLLIGVLSALGQRYFQAATAVGVAIGLLLLKAVLDQYSTLIVIGGIVAAVWFAHQYGLSRIRDKALAGFKKLSQEGPDKVKEATALLRIADPKVDKSYRRGEHRRVHTTGFLQVVPSDSQSSPPAPSGSGSGTN